MCKDGIGKSGKDLGFHGRAPGIGELLFLALLSLELAILSDSVSSKVAKRPPQP